MAIGALFLTLGDLLISGFAVLAALLLGAALGLPVILGFVLYLGERSTGRALTTWFWADSRQQLSGLSLALMALLLALAVNVGVSTMVESFSRTFTGWLDGRLAADVYINASDNAQAAEIKAWLSQRPEVDAMLPSGRAEVQLRGWPVEVLGLADHATYRDRWPLLQSKADAWDHLRDGNGAMISEQLARRFKLGLGDRIALPASAGDWPLEVAGIYADYGNPKGQAAVNIDALVQRFPEIPQTRLGLRVASPAIPSLIAAIKDKFGLDSRNLSDQATLKAEFDADIQPHLCGHRRAEYFHARRRRRRAADKPAYPEQFAIAATGAAMGDRHYAAAARRHRTLKTMSVALITALLALPLGLLVAWCLIAVVNVKAFGWRLPFHLFPLQLLELLAVAMLAAFLAALLPVLKLARMQPAKLVKIFADER